MISEPIPIRLHEVDVRDFSLEVDGDGQVIITDGRLCRPDQNELCWFERAGGITDNSYRC